MNYVIADFAQGLCQWLKTNDQLTIANDHIPRGSWTLNIRQHPHLHWCPIKNNIYTDFYLSIIPVTSRRQLTTTYYNITTTTCLHIMGINTTLACSQSSLVPNERRGSKLFPRNTVIGPHFSDGPLFQRPFSSAPFQRPFQVALSNDDCFYPMNEKSFINLERRLPQTRSQICFLAFIAGSSCVGLGSGLV